MLLQPSEQPGPVDRETFQARFLAVHPQAPQEDIEASWCEYRLWHLACKNLLALLARRGPAHCQFN